MIGGICTIIVAIWFYNAAIKHETGNAIRWAIIGALVFFATQLIWHWANVAVIVADQERSMLEIRNRAEGPHSTVGGMLMAVYLELSPILLGFLAAWAVLTKYALKRKIKVVEAVSNLVKKK